MSTRFVGFTLAFLLPAAVAAQKPPEARTFTTVGFSQVSLVADGDEAFMMVDLAITKLRPRGFAPEFGVSLFPRALTIGAIAGAMEVGPTISLMTSDEGRIFVRFGGGVVGGVGDGEAAALPEAYLGAGALMGKRTMIRADAAIHTLLPYGFPILKLGFAIGGAMEGRRSGVATRPHL